MGAHADISLDFNNMMMDSIGPAGLKREEIDRLLPQVRTIFQGLTDLRRLGQLPFRDLPYHEEAAQKIIAEATRLRERFDTILLLGIGGSILGASFLAEALQPGVKSNLVLCGHADPSGMKEIAYRLDFKKTAVVVVSKSGKTIETLAAFLFFRRRLEETAGGGWKDRFVIITDLHEGPLRRIAVENGIVSFEIPPGVGGRFSVLTPAGLFPAACAGVNIPELLAGARRMDERCKNPDPWFNPALMNAILHYLLDLRKGRKIRVVMPYGERLKAYAGWFAQLWAESLGKRISLKGKEIHAGTTPVSASGPADQHSQLQLYLEGPGDKTITFLGAEEEEGDVTLPNDFSDIPDLKTLGGRSASNLLEVERLATERTLAEAGCPNQTILLKKTDPFSIGQLLYMAGVETVFAGELYNVNPFDQPAVEKIKKNIRELLSGKIPERKNRAYIV